MSKSLNLVSFVICSLLTLNCKQQSTQPTPADQNSQQTHSIIDDQIRESIFRYQIGQNLPGYFNLSVTFLANVEVDSVGNFKNYIDPSDTLVNRIKTDYPNVEKYSQSHYNGDYYFSSDSTRPGILLNVYPWQFATSSGIKVDGGYYVGNLSSTGYTYYLHKNSNSWIVDSTHVKWVS